MPSVPRENSSVSTAADSTEPGALLTLSAHADDFILQNVAQGVHAVNAHVGDGSAAGHCRSHGAMRARVPPRREMRIQTAQKQSCRSVLRPLALVNARCSLRSGRPGRRPAAIRRCAPLRPSCDTRSACTPIGFSHKDRFAAAEGQQHVGQMAGIGSGDQHGVDFRRAAHLLGRIKGQRDIVLPGRLLRFVQRTSRQRSDAAVLRQREPRHQPFDRVQSKPENPKANQEWTMWRGRPRPRFLQLILVLLLFPPGAWCR